MDTEHKRILLLERKLQVGGAGVAKERSGARTPKASDAPGGFASPGRESLPVPLVRVITGYIGIYHIELALADGKCSDTLAWRIGRDGDLMAMEKIPGIHNDDGMGVSLYACVIVGGVESGDPRLIAMGKAIPETIAKASVRFGDFDFVNQIAKVVDYSSNSYPISELASRWSAASYAIKNGNMTLAEAWVKHYMCYSPEGTDGAYYTALQCKYPEMLDIFVQLGLATWTKIASEAFVMNYRPALKYAIQKDPSALDVDSTQYQIPQAWQQNT